MAKQIKLGNMVARLTEVLGIPHCPKCEQRRLILNEIQKLGFWETIRKMRVAGQNKSDEEEKNLEEIISKLNDCCK